MLQARSPMHDTHVFLVDVSHAAITSGATQAACSAIGAALSALPGDLPSLADESTSQFSLYIGSSQRLQVA